jgi:hypothetical protein
MATEEEKQKTVEQIDWGKVMEWDQKYNLHVRQKVLEERDQYRRFSIRFLRALR